MPRIYCPFCNQYYDVESSVIGQKVRCAVCNEKFYAQMNEPITLQLKDESNTQAKKPTDNQAKKTTYTYNQAKITIPKQSKDNNVLNFLSTVVVLVLLVLAWGSLTGDGCSSGSSNHVEINGRYHITDGAAGFSSKDSLDKYFHYYNHLF